MVGDTSIAGYGYVEISVVYFINPRAVLSFGLFAQIFQALCILNRPSLITAIYIIAGGEKRSRAIS